MTARNYILDTPSVRRNSPLVVATLLTHAVKQYLGKIGKEDLALAITSVNSFMGNSVTIVTNKPIINFELRAFEGELLEVIKKVLSQHKLPTEIFLTYK